MRSVSIISLLLLGFILFGTIASANVVTTTMTWFVATAKSISVTYGSPCTSAAFFFVEANAQHDPDADGNAARVVPSSTRAADANCQSSSQAAMSVSNTGTGALNVDANFASALAGADVNLVLKVWQGSTGCGTAGLGGWEKDCSVSSTTVAPGTTTCKNFNSSNWTAGSRVITALDPFASTQLCYSGDFNSFVSTGDHNASQQLGSDFS
ncbi:MAG: hypothetical protein U1C71_04605 [archaeon]|nr:hypothetical protein [archaeon]